VRAETRHSGLGRSALGAPQRTGPGPRGGAALIAAALLAHTAGPLGAQATITGRIRNDSTRAPIAGVEIAFEGSGPRAVTDTAGHFVIDGVPTGVRFAVVRKIGFRPIRLRTLIGERDTIEVDLRLRPTAVELEPIEVTAAAVPPGMQAFAERRLGGVGHFIDSRVLRQSEHRRLSELLRGVRGVRLVPARGTRTVAMSRSNCPMSIWIDGIRSYQPGRGLPPPDIDEFPIVQLEGVEIYRGPAETPLELGGTGQSCGAIVLWTRRS
jgi:hypothetical protein